MSETTTVWGILAGGRGTRYGEPKATARYGDGTFLDHCLGVVRRCKSARDPIAVSVASDWSPVLSDDCIAVVDAEFDPGPAHSIGRLAEYARSIDADLVVLAVDLLKVTPHTLARLGDRLCEQRLSDEPRVLVSWSGEREHWVLVGIPSALTAAVATNAQSVSAIQVLLRLCPIEHFAVSADELLDVNTPDRLPHGEN